jgi:putative PIN family toxin of toxin-antitoxin system
MRVVIDTNVVVAALRSRRGASNALLIRLLSGEGSWLCSVPLFLEYEAVLMRPDFRLETGYAGTDLTGFLRDIATVIQPVELFFLWRPQLADAKDEMVLETAVNGGADCIVSHNTRDFREAAARFGIRAVPPRDCLEGQLP